MHESDPVPTGVRSADVNLVAPEASVIASTRLRRPYFRTGQPRARKSHSVGGARIRDAVSEYVFVGPKYASPILAHGENASFWQPEKETHSVGSRTGLAPR